MESKKIQGQGYRLGSICKQELEDALHVSSKTNSELIDNFKNLQVVYSKFSKNIKQENAQLQHNFFTLVWSDFASFDFSDKAFFNEPEKLKLEATLRFSSAVSGGDEKNISIFSHPVTAFSNDSSSVSQSDAPTSNKPKLDFLKHRNNMDQTERIDAHQSSDTINKANDDTKPQITNSPGLSNMKSSTSEDSHADNSQIVETKNFSEEAISKTDFIGNDQNYATKIEMAEILPIGALGACETLVNDKYQIPPIVKLVILIIIAILIIWFVHKLIIWNKEKSTKSKSKNGFDRSKISDTIAIIVQKLPLGGLSIALCINHTWNKEVKLELHMRHEKFKNQYWRTVSVRYMEIQLKHQEEEDEKCNELFYEPVESGWLYPWSKYEIEETINPIDYELNILFDETEIWSSL
nr:2401_t:CDS:2 [Entrophospora candida]